MVRQKCKISRVLMNGTDLFWAQANANRQPIPEAIKRFQIKIDITQAGRANSIDMYTTREAPNWYEVVRQSLNRILLLADENVDVFT